jgi:hypothetical protein
MGWVDGLNWLLGAIGGSMRSVVLIFSGSGACWRRFGFCFQPSCDSSSFCGFVVRMLCIDFSLPLIGRIGRAYV